jgi:hypothetical protein
MTKRAPRCRIRWAHIRRGEPQGEPQQRIRCVKLLQAARGLRCVLPVRPNRLREIANVVFLGGSARLRYADD